MKVVKLLQIILVVFMLFIGVSLLKNDLNFIKSACATQWGSCNPDPNYQICPRTNTSYSGCLDSANFNVNINGTGIPNGQKFDIEIFPSDGSGDSCSNVTCLKRTTNYTTPSGWNGSPYSVMLDQIGCSPGGCTNNYTVRVRFAEPYVDSTLNCPNPPDYTTTIQNGGSVNANFNINCSRLVQCPTTPPTATINCNDNTKTVTCSWTNVTGATDWNADLSKENNLVCRSQWFSGGNGTNGACTSNATSRNITYTNATSGTYNCLVGALFDPSSGCSQLVSTPQSCSITSPPTNTPSPTNKPNVTNTPIPTNRPGVTNTPVPSNACTKPGTPTVRVTCVGCGENGSNPTPTPIVVTPTSIIDNPTPTIDNPTPTCNPQDKKNSCILTPSPSSVPNPTQTIGFPPGFKCKDNSLCQSGKCVDFVCQ